MKRLMQNALIACTTVLLTLVLLEGVVRLLGETDADGQFTFMGYALEPYALPVTALVDGIENYISSADTKYHTEVIYDEMLGWTWAPHAMQLSGKLTFNGASLRSQREYSQEPPPDTLRIALFGDSFTQSVLPDDQAWGNLLEIKLNQAGIRTEVLNFGVGGYGMDQAFLRYQHEGQHYSPDIVVFGFQPIDLHRNVNIFLRLTYHRHIIPFSKPRFVLTDQGLELLNQPTLHPEEMIAVFESFENHPLAPYEAYYQSRNVAGRWWASSRLAAFVFEVLKQQNEEMQKDRGPGSERGMLGQAIVDAFAADVKAHDTTFFVLHLPTKHNLRRYHRGEQASYQFLLDHFEDSYHYITLDEYLDPVYVDEVYYPDGTHYGPEIDGILAQTVADAMQSCVESPACDLPRFEDRTVLFRPPPPPINIKRQRTSSMAFLYILCGRMREGEACTVEVLPSFMGEGFRVGVSMTFASRFLIDWQELL